MNLNEFKVMYAKRRQEQEQIIFNENMEKIKKLEIEKQNKIKAEQEEQMKRIEIEKEIRWKNINNTWRKEQEEQEKKDLIKYKEKLLSLEIPVNLLNDTEIYLICKFGIDVKLSRDIIYNKCHILV